MRCPYCGKYLKEVWDGWICVCGYEDRIDHTEPSQTQLVNEEIHNHYWYDEEPTTDEAKEYCDYWHGGSE